MNDSGGSFADETIDMVSESANNASAELRKRRSTRIVQAVPLVVTGVDALGRPFVERTSSLIINCMAAATSQTLRPEKYVGDDGDSSSGDGQPPRTVRGRVAWIQRPARCGSFFKWLLSWKFPATSGHRIPSGRLECVLRHGAGCNQVGCGTRHFAIATRSD